MKKKPKSLLSKYRQALKEIKALKTRPVVALWYPLYPEQEIYVSLASDNVGIWGLASSLVDIKRGLLETVIKNVGSQTVYITPNLGIIKKKDGK